MTEYRRNPKNLTRVPLQLITPSPKSLDPNLLKEVSCPPDKCPRKKYFWLSLTKQVKDLYDKIFKSLKKEVEEDIRRWNDVSCSWIDRANLVKLAIL